MAYRIHFIVGDVQPESWVARGKKRQLVPKMRARDTRFKWQKNERLAAEEENRQSGGLPCFLRGKNLQLNTHKCISWGCSGAV
jgi:hypothetical protein